MKKEFTFKEAKEIIEGIRNVISDLSFSSKYIIAAAKEIENQFIKTKNYVSFDAFVSKEIQGRKTCLESEDFNKLILMMRKYLISSKHADYCNDLINLINENTSLEIEKLKTASNPVVWLFSSKKKKEEAIHTYENLKDYLDFNYIIESKEAIKNNKNYNNTNLEEAFIDFNANKKEYEILIKKITQLHDNKKQLEIVEKLYDVTKKCNSKISFAQEKSPQIKDDIKKSIEYFIATELLNLLKSMPIDEINRDKRGIRIKALKDAGYYTIADAFTAKQYQLSSIYGISEDAAYTIKTIAEEYAIQAQKELKIKVSYDNRNKASSDLVNKIYVYRQINQILVDINKLYDDYAEVIDVNLKKLSEIGSGLYWLFYSDEYKQEIKDCYNEAYKVIKKEYEPKIKELTNLINALLNKEDKNKAWEDFKEHSIEYYNLIEKISPGVLGNDDVLYGLPEELARQIQEEAFFPDGLLCELRRYQEWGVKYILHQERVLLGDEMGLGKTVQAIATMVSLKNVGGTHFVVICPASVVTNWCREITKHSKLRVFKAHGRAKKSVVNDWLKTGGVVVTTFESASVFDLEDSYKFCQLIVDEAHYIKNRSAYRTITTIELSKHAERLLFMTGTPLENNVDEMISLIEILNPELAAEIQNIAFMSAADEFRNKIAPVYYRRKREDVLTELPELIENEEWCTMTKEEEDRYEESTYAKNFMAMRRVSWDVDDLKNSSKMNRLKEIIEDAKNDGRKVLVFSFFLDTIGKISQSLGYQKCLNPITGKIPAQRRQQIIDSFNEAPAGTVLCAQINSGGTGLNIQAASVVVICEPQLKPSIENQAISRAYRMGQSRNVQVFRLMCEDSVDERIKEILELKQLEFDVFADKSVAAENVEIEETSYGDIIKEEIERIKNKKNNNNNNEILSH